jgi:hypothetical protein
MMFDAIVFSCYCQIVAQATFSERLLRFELATIF